MLGIDKGNTNAAVLEFDSIYGVHYPSVSGVEGGGTNVHWDYNIMATPTMVIILPDRSIAYKQIFPPSHQNLTDSLLTVGGIMQNCLTATPEPESSNFNLFPNPVHGISFIEPGPGLSPPYQVRVYQSTGIPVISKTYTGTAKRLSLDTQSLPNGIYLVHLTDKKGLEITKRLVVQGQ